MAKPGHQGRDSTRGPGADARRCSWDVSNLLSTPEVLLGVLGLAGAEGISRTRFSRVNQH